MKNSILFFAMLAGALCGCGESAQSTPAFAVEKKAESSAQSGGDVTLPLEVDEAAVREIETAALAGAAWTGKACELASPTGATQVIATKGSRNQLAGFVIDPEDKPPGDFDFVLKGERSFRIPVSTGWSRIDVAEFFKAPQLATAGFQFSTQFDAVPPGTYGVDFYITSPKGHYFCESGKTILVK
jgi:hypothetical protein